VTLTKQSICDVPNDQSGRHLEAVRREDERTISYLACRRDASGCARLEAEVNSVL
jgi:hypothetical protein